MDSHTTSSFNGRQFYATDATWNVGGEPQLLHGPVLRTGNVALALAAEARSNPQIGPPRLAV